jgi:hypothetical protein
MVLTECSWAACLWPMEVSDCVHRGSEVVR